jgi:prolyl oligopeptidase
MTADPFRWLEDATSAATRAWTLRQDQIYRDHTDMWPMRGRLAARLTDLCATGSAGTPRPAGGRLFVPWLAPGAEHPAVIAVEPDGARRAILDPALLDPSGATTVEAWDLSPDGELLAYQESVGGTEDSRLAVLNTETLECVDGPIDRVRRSSIAWLPDGAGFYYVRRLHPSLHPGEEQYHRRVYLHRLGTAPDDDILIFGEGRGKTQHYTVSTAPDGRWLVLTAAAGTSPSRDVWIADLAEAGPAAPRFTVAHEGVAAASSVRLRAGTGPGGVCHLLTSLRASRRRLMTAAPGSPLASGWAELVPEDPEAVLEDFVILDGVGLPRPVLVLSWTRHAAGEITVHDLDGRRLDVLALPPHCTVGRLRAEAVGAREAWFTVATFTEPATAFRYDATAGTPEPWHLGPAQPRSPGTVPSPGSPQPGAPSAPPPQSAAIVTRQVVYTSRDGTPVRMFVLAPSGRPVRPRPALLTGYGGFGQSLVPAYSPEIAAWVQAGGVYAVANLRGGGEEGEAWHRAGMGEHKENTFDDFDAAADYLIAQGWTTPYRLGIWGASNGGLLTAVAMTRRPERYAAVAALAPLTDMARYELTGLGPTWTAEYGSASVPDQAAWLMSYSPYHHVRPGAAYPAVLLAGFDGDSRVDPMHARKMCAALQAATSSGQPVLLRFERGAGHGARPTSRLTALLADLLSFFAVSLGLGDDEANRS